MLRNNRGYTLVEVMVTLTLLTIFIACVVAIVSPVLRIYNRTVSVAEDQSIAVNIADYLAGRVRLSNHFEVTDEGRSIVLDGVKYTMQDGYLVTSNGLVFDSAYYGSAKIGLEFEHADNNPFVDIKVHVFREGEEKYSYSLTARPLVFLGKDEEGEEPEYGYEAGDLVLKDDETGAEIYLSGSWQPTKHESASLPWGGLLLTPGTLYRDHTGVYIIGESTYLSKSFAETDPTLEEAHQNHNAGYVKVDTSRVWTDADVDWNASPVVWKNPPHKGSIWYTNGKYYVLLYPAGDAKYSSSDPNQNWRQIIQL
jgi:prepilin-type N-terminal cleavage/methylation domain-containing protein